MPDSHPAAILRFTIRAADKYIFKESISPVVQGAYLSQKADEDLVFTRMKHSPQYIIYRISTRTNEEINRVKLSKSLKVLDLVEEGAVPSTTPHTPAAFSRRTVKGQDCRSSVKTSNLPL